MPPVSLLRLSGAALLLSLSACAPRTVVMEPSAPRADETASRPPARPSRTASARPAPARPASARPSEGTSDASGSPSASARRPASATLVMPVEGVRRDQLRDSYNANRSGGRLHRAIDIAAPQGTPVLAAGSGTVRQMRENELGGITMVVVATDGRMVHYYAHLDRYADGLREGDRVSAGQHIAYVGTTGNAQGAHLHFATWRIADPARYWQGEVVNPYPMLRGTPPEPVLADARRPSAAPVSQTTQRPRPATEAERRPAPAVDRPARPTVDEQVRAAAQNQRPPGTRPAVRPADGAPAAPAAPPRRVGW